MSLLDKLKQFVKKSTYVQENFLNEHGALSENKVNLNLLDNPKDKAGALQEISAEFKDSDQARHTLASQFTTETLRKKMGVFGNSFVGRIAAVAGANILGFGHEYKAGWNESSKEDLINNFRGSLVGGVGGTDSYVPGVVKDFLGTKSNSKNKKSNIYNKNISKIFPDGNFNRADEETDIYFGSEPDYNSATLDKTPVKDKPEMLDTVEQKHRAVFETLRPKQ